MKTCPYCSYKIPERETLCPKCGRPYWNPDSSDKLKIDKEEEEGCLSIFILPFIVSLITAAILIITGLILNLFIHFESSQIKIIWLGISILFGVIAFRVIRLYKKNREN